MRTLRWTSLVYLVLLGLLHFIVRSPWSAHLASAQKFGILDAIEEAEGILGTGISSESNSQTLSHLYDIREFLGQPVTKVCETLDLLSDLLYITTESCMPPRIVRSIRNPVILIPTRSSMGDDREGCVAQSTTPASVDGFSNLFPFYMFGYGLSEIVPGIISQGFRWDNAVVIHMCDGESFCGREEMEATIERLHAQFVTTLQCWLQPRDAQQFNLLFGECLQLLTLLPNADRRILIVPHTKNNVIAASLKVMTDMLVLNMLAEVTFVLPSWYQITEQDFLIIKDRDIVRVVRWRAEYWLSSVTSRIVQHYVDFWMNSAPLKPEATNIYSKQMSLAGLLSTISTTEYYSRVIESRGQNRHSVCGNNTSPSPEIQEVMRELAKLLSCSENAGWEVCTSYSVTRYDIDPMDNMPHVYNTGIWYVGNQSYHGMSYRSVNDLGGRMLTVVSMELPPFMAKNETAFQLLSSGAASVSDKQYLYHGIIPNMLQTLSRVLNFRYKIIFPPSGDNFYGSRDTNGSWNGMVGMLARGEVEMVAADLTITAEREEVVHFTVPFFEDPITVLLPRSEFDKSLFTFLLPFNKIVWICVIGVVALSGPLLYFFSRLSPYYPATGKPNHFASLSEAYMYCYGAIVSQGGQITPDSDSARIFMAFWWLFGICTVATYSGNLIAFLTFPGRLQFIDNFDDFVYQSNIQPVVTRNSYIEIAFRTAEKQIYRDIWKKITKNPEAGLVDEYDTAVQMVSRLKYGYIGQQANMRVTIAEDSELPGQCRFAMMRKAIEKSKYALGFRRGTNYAPLFDKWIQRLVFSGLIAHWADREWQGNYKPKRCQQQLESRPDEIRKVQIEDVIGVYICWAVGLTLACILFAAERLTLTSHRLGRACRNFFNKRSKAGTETSPQSFDLKVITLNNGMVLESR
ncbi:uncharacterized protein LOC129585211 [Paramacrobiotus metropolitanus]|uniref:uncharacterized protein LOC129585211 n=1 Tax=Paramacrobiotus metropolitanus TaxID=2943436 RepID=UPI00244564FC|nr:uncharacterized protein LOC129585211 [Paramacrobiotus metropolitanus]